MRKLILSLLFFVALSACARPGPSSLQVVSAPPGAKQVSVLVASNRQKGDDPYGGFASGRSHALHYLEVTISIPPGHRSPDIEWPQGKPDAAKTFAVVKRQDLTEREFVARAQAGVRSAPSGTSAGLFVHGYNYTYQEALFRLAQMAADAGVSGPPILFDWPSQGAVTGYVADRDSVAFSRDDMVSVLTALSKGGVRSTILAHSMGAWLTSESLRQLRLTGEVAVLRSIDQVILAAPDIDIDLFQRQLAVTGRLQKPIVVLAAKDDRALMLSSVLSGGYAEAGSLDVDDPRTVALARSHNLQIVDISSFKSANGSNHDRFASLAAAYPQLQKAGQANDVAGAGALILNGVGSVVAAPFRVGGSLLSQ